MKLSTSLSREPEHTCIFGLPKSGKTTLVGQLAEQGRELLWISMDNGHSVLKYLSPAAQERIELINIKDTRTNAIAAHTCLSIIKGGWFNICDGHGIIECRACKANGISFTRINLHDLGSPNKIVVFDPISQLVTSMTNAIIKKECKSDDEEKQDMYKLDFGDWAKLGNMMDRFLSEIQQAPFHCICITHVMESELEDKNKRLVPLAGTVNFSANSPKYFDSVIYASVGLGGHTFGSATTFKLNTVTGSRSKIKIEEQKGGPNLLPFFPSIPEHLKLLPPAKVVEDRENAKTILGQVVAGGEVIVPASDNSNATEKPAPSEVAPKTNVMDILKNLKRG